MKAIESVRNPSIVKKILVSLAVLISFVAFILLIGFYILVTVEKLSLMDLLITLMPQSGLSKNVNVLVLGIDDTDGVQRSDSIMLLHIDTNHNKIGVISIPRDTRVSIPGRGMDKLNHAYAFGGVLLSAQAVSNFLQVPIDFYVTVRLSGLVRLIDELGGITIDVEKRMHYTDHSQHLFIDLQPGPQLLNGTQAMGYVRFRHDPLGDLGRIKRQQNFIKALAAKIMESGKIFKDPHYFHELAGNVTTNLSLRKMFTFGLTIRSAFENNSVVIDTLPGEPIMLHGVSYIQPDIPGMIKVVDRLVNGFENIEAQSVVSPSVVAHSEPVARMTTKPTTSLVSQEGKRLSIRVISKLIPTIEAVPTSSFLPSGMKLTVEILNGQGSIRVARQAGHWLKTKKVKVAWVKQAAHQHYLKTVLIDWKGQTHDAVILANALHIDPRNIITYNKPDKKIDFSLVLGQDWLRISKTLK